MLNAVRWLEGVDTPGTFSEIPALWGLYLTYYLAMMHYLDGVAGRALQNFRPALMCPDAEYARLCYELTTMPARSVWLVGLTGVIITLLAQQSPAVMPEFPYATSPLSAGIGSALTVLANFFVAVSVYHTIRQLRLVSRIHKTVTHVNLFQREPLFAFSVLTARTGVGYLLAFSIGVAPRTGAAVYSIVTAIIAHNILVPLAIAAFILPLWSISRMLAAEKRRLKNEASARLQKALGELHHRVDADSLKEMGDLKITIDSLLVEQEMLAKIPTWPWNTRTFAGFLSAFTLPIIIWLTQQILNRLMNS